MTTPPIIPKLNDLYKTFFFYDKKIDLPTRIPGLEKRSRQRFVGTKGIRDVDDKSEPFRLFESRTAGFISGRLTGIVSPNICESS